MENGCGQSWFYRPWQSTRQARSAQMQYPTGSVFLFVSCCLLIATIPQITWKQWIIMGLLFILLFLAKINMAILAFLPFFILPASRSNETRFTPTRNSHIAACLIEVGGWNILAYSRFYTAYPGQILLHSCLISSLTHIDYLGGDYRPWHAHTFLSKRMDCRFRLWLLGPPGLFIYFIHWHLSQLCSSMAIPNQVNAPVLVFSSFLD